MYTVTSQTSIPTIFWLVDLYISQIVCSFIYFFSTTTTTTTKDNLIALLGLNAKSRRSPLISMSSFWMFIAAETAEKIMKM